MPGLTLPAFALSAPAVLLGILVAFFYVVPAVILHLVSSSLADPRREAWLPPPDAEAWKQRYRLGAFFGQYVNLFLLGLFFVQVLMGLVLARSGCDRSLNHLSAAAFNLAILIDRLFVVGIVVLALFAVAAFVWSVLYFRAARRAQWPDPRRRDAMIVHGGLVPLAVFLMFVAFSMLLRTLCPDLV